MDLEKELFKNCIVNLNKLLDYGFIKDNNSFIYEKNFLNDSFKAVIIINDNNINGKIIDLDTNLEYYNFRLKEEGTFSNIVKDEYQKILLDIRDNCFNKDYFSSEQANRITKYIYNFYGLNIMMGFFVIKILINGMVLLWK